MNVVNYFGVSVSATTPSTPKTSPSSYLITNSEIRFDSSLLGFDMYALNSGNIIIQVSLP